jgi:hypothetical protein
LQLHRRDARKHFPRLVIPSEVCRFAREPAYGVEGSRVCVLRPECLGEFSPRQTKNCVGPAQQIPPFCRNDKAKGRNWRTGMSALREPWRSDGVQQIAPFGRNEKGWTSSKTEECPPCTNTKGGLSAALQTFPELSTQVRTFKCSLSLTDPRVKGEYTLVT